MPKDGTSTSPRPCPHFTCKSLKSFYLKQGIQRYPNIPVVRPKQHKSWTNSSERGTLKMQSHSFFKPTGRNHPTTLWSFYLSDSPATQTFTWNPHPKHNTLQLSFSPSVIYRSSEWSCRRWWSKNKTMLSVVLPPLLPPPHPPFLFHCTPKSKTLSLGFFCGAWPE